MMGVDKNIFSSGQFGGRLTVQSLFLKTEKNDLIIISGCAHPGLEAFILKGQTISNKIKSVVGGFHGFRNFSFLEGVEFIGACHCTQRIREIKQRFSEQFNDICVGNSYLF
jgi:7,8-dihydropterin-6-yl-methyl-4-(beta-D-ribofuranosyl)aminobenzene 5'-phosphate synthase